MRRYRIITFNSHQPYLHLFAPLPVEMDIIQLKDHQRFLQEWSSAVRPLPERWQLITMEEAGERIKAGRYDLAMAHNVSDYIDFNRFAIPRIMVVHTSLTGRILEENSTIQREEYLSDVKKLIEMTQGRLVFISEFKKKDWGLPGEVILHGIEISDYPDYQGHEPAVLRVANNLKERDLILDYRAHLELTRGFPTNLIGDNPQIPGSKRSESWEDLKGLYRSHRLYLNTVVEKCEDGFNLAMLEAMATGMPVVSTAHSTSPIQDG